MNRFSLYLSFVKEISQILFADIFNHSIESEYLKSIVFAAIGIGFVLKIIRIALFCNLSDLSGKSEFVSLPKHEARFPQRLPL